MFFARHEKLIALLFGEQCQSDPQVAQADRKIHVRL